MRLLALISILSLAACAGGIQQDKVQHAIMGAGVSVVATELGAPPFWACVSALGAGLVKEYRDSRTGGTVEVMDVVATGSACAITLFKF